MHKRFIICTLFSLIIFCPYLLFAQNKIIQKKLIEFGWDYPTISFLKNGINEMQIAPFDGIVFSFDFDIYKAFDTRQLADSIFHYKYLSEIPWQKFTDNFLLVRGASYTGAHWLDDKSWTKIIENLKKVSKALRLSSAKGIGFDPEYYYNDSTLNPWVYNSSWYNNLSYQEVGNYVRKRGKQFMQSLQTYKPDVKILCFWLLDLADMQSKTQPISKTGMALYPFFVEGMLEGKNKTSEIIDGNESSYWYQKPENYIMAGEYLKENGSKLITYSKAKFKEVSLAQAIYFDWIYAKLPLFDKGFSKQTKEGLLRNNLYFALKTTDKYVWFYNERINWWKAEVDPGVLEIIKQVKKKIKAEENNINNQISGNSLVFDFKKKGFETYQGFSYNYEKNKNIIAIKLLNKDIKRLQVYNNSKLIYTFDNPSLNFTINLNNNKETFIIMSEDNSGITSIAFIN